MQYRLSWQQEVGLIKREELRWVPKKPNCEGGQGFVSVGMNEIKPALNFLISGYGISVLLAIAENLYRFIYARFQKPKNNSNLVENTLESKNTVLNLHQNN